MKVREKLDDVVNKVELVQKVFRINGFSDADVYCVSKIFYDLSKKDISKEHQMKLDEWFVNNINVEKKRG